MKDDTIYLGHILECIKRIEEHATQGRDAFLSSHTLQDATLRNLQTMSEATQRLSDVTKATQPQIPWRQIGAFRNIVVHNYLGLDLYQIWVTIEKDIPPLKLATQEMLAAQP